MGGRWQYWPSRESGGRRILSCPQATGGDEDAARPDQPHRLDGHVERKVGWDVALDALVESADDIPDIFCVGQNDGRKPLLGLGKPLNLLIKIRIAGLFEAAQQHHRSQRTCENRSDEHADLDVVAGRSAVPERQLTD
jgi:hypothetical protein